MSTSSTSKEQIELKFDERYVIKEIIFYNRSPPPKEEFVTYYSDDWQQNYYLNPQTIPSFNIKSTN